jgi:hypothetical protein
MKNTAPKQLGPGKETGLVPIKKNELAPTDNKKDLVPINKKVPVDEPVTEAVPPQEPMSQELVPVPLEPSRTSPSDLNTDIESVPGLTSPSAAVAAGAVGAVVTGKEDKKARDLAEETGVPYDIVVQWLATQETK